MAVEENYLKNKILYKTQLCLLKVIPMVMAFIFWINTVLSYFDIDLEVFSYIGSCSIITMVYLYISSYVFRFCEYHRMFLHYVCIIWLINIYGCYFPKKSYLLFFWSRIHLAILISYTTRRHKYCKKQ